MSLARKVLRLKLPETALRDREIFLRFLCSEADGKEERFCVCREMTPEIFAGFRQALASGGESSAEMFVENLVAEFRAKIAPPKSAEQNLPRLGFFRRVAYAVRYSRLTLGLYERRLSAEEKAELSSEEHRT